MRILWISFWGSWTKPLLSKIKDVEGIEVGIIIPVPGKNDKYQTKIDGIQHFKVGIPEKELYNNMQATTFKYYKWVIDVFKPDVIHVHGTEKNLAQIQNYVKDIPVIISIQGIMFGYLRHNLNFLLPVELYKFTSVKNLLGRGGAFQMEKIFKNSLKYEPDIFKNGRFFIGRTSWDKAHVLFVAKEATYFKGDELLRESFLKNAGKWEVTKCDRHTIFMPSGFNAIKGLHWAIETVNLLKQFYPNVKLYVPGIPIHLINYNILKSFLIGESYINFILAKIKKLNLSEHVFFLPHLDETQMVELMVKANVFLSPTSIDNSPNSVGEANMIGIPVVNSAVGGVTSFLKDEKSCLLSPAGDPFLMAYQIRRVFDDDNLAKALSREGLHIAQIRHNPEATVKQYMEAYQTAIQLNKKYN